MIGGIEAKVLPGECCLVIHICFESVLCLTYYESHLKNTMLTPKSEVMVTGHNRMKDNTRQRRTLKNRLSGSKIFFAFV